MKIPITPRWAWLGELGEPQLLQDQAQLEQLPFSIPPIDDKPAQTAMFVPITNGPTTEKGQTVPPPVIGGITLFAPHPAAFTQQDLVYTALIAERVGIAISQARQAAQDRDST
jgi:GAF domain-containing protein